MAIWCTLNKGIVVPTVDAIELQIEQLLAKYTEALQSHQKGNYEQAKQQYEQLLRNKLVGRRLDRQQDEDTLNITQEGPALSTVRFLVLKNYASLLKDQFESDQSKSDLAEIAIQKYLQALTIDPTDQSIWYEAGSLCQQLKRWRLARLAYENGVCSATEQTKTSINKSSAVSRVSKIIGIGNFSPMQWKCVQGLCEVLVVLGDHSLCLHYIDTVLRTCPDWHKGYQLKDDIHNASKLDDIGGIHSIDIKEGYPVPETIDIEVKEPNWPDVFEALLKQYKETRFNVIELTDGDNDSNMETSMETIKHSTSDKLLDTAVHNQPIHISFREAAETDISAAVTVNDANTTTISDIESKQELTPQTQEAATTRTDTAMMSQSTMNITSTNDAVSIEDATGNNTQAPNEQVASLKRRRSTEDVDEDEGQDNNGEENGEEDETEEKRTSLRTFKRKKVKMANEEISRRKMLEEEKEFLNKVEAFYDKVKRKNAPFHVDIGLKDAGESFQFFWSWFDSKVSELDSTYFWDIKPIMPLTQGNKENAAGGRKLLLFTLSYPKAVVDNDNNNSCYDKTDIKLFVQELNLNNSGLTDALCRTILGFVENELDFEEHYPLPNALLELITNTIIQLESNLISMIASDACLSERDRLRVALRISEYLVDRLTRNTVHSEEEASRTIVNRKRGSVTAKRKLQETMLEQCELWASFVSQYLCVLSPNWVLNDMSLFEKGNLAASSADQQETYLRFCFIKAKLSQCRYDVEVAYKWFMTAKSIFGRLNKSTLGLMEINVHSLYDSYINMETVGKKLELLNTARLYNMAQKKMAELDYQGVISDLECLVDPILNNEQLDETVENIQMVNILGDAYFKTDRYPEAWKCDTFVFSNLIQQLLCYGNQQSSLEHRPIKDQDKHFLDCVSKINDVLDKLIKLQCMSEFKEYMDRANEKLFNQLACLLKMTIYYTFRHPDFIPLVNNFTEPGIPQHRPSKKTRVSIFNSVIVKAWVCQSYLVNTMFAYSEQAMLENAGLLRTWAEVVQELHDELGEREICGASNGVFLLHLLDTLVKVDNKRFRRDIYQCYHCLYGVHLAAETDAIEEHHCTHRQMNQKAAEPLFALIVNAAIEKLRSGTLLKADLKDVIDTVSDHFHDLPEKHHPLIKYNHDTIEKYFNSGIQLYATFDDLLRSSMIPTMEIDPQKTKTSTVFYKIFWIRGKTLRVQINNRPKGIGTDKNLNDLEDAVEQFKTHVVLNPADADGWIELATCYQLLAEEELNWSASNIGIRKAYICDIQRRAFHAYVRGISLDNLQPQNAAKHSLFSNFGNLLYSMVSSPMNMGAFNLQDTKLVLDENGAPTTIANPQPSSSAIYKFACFMYTTAFDYPAVDQWRSYYMAGKCLGKLKRPAEEVIPYYFRAIKKAKPNNQEKREPILEPVYTFYTALLKYLLSGQISPQYALDMINKEKDMSYITSKQKESEQSTMTQEATFGPVIIDLTDDNDLNLGEQTETDGPGPVDMSTVYDIILMRLNDIRAYDTKGWHHRPLYRVSWMQFHIYHDPEKAKSELMKFFNFKEKARSFINIWKTSFELPGKHYEYNNKYTLFLIELAKETNDMQTLKQLYKKLRRAQSIIVTEASTFYSACIAYLDVFDERLTQTHFSNTILRVITRSKMQKEQFENIVAAQKAKIADDDSEVMQQLKRDLQDLAELRMHIQGHLAGKDAITAEERLHKSIQLVFSTMLFGGTANNHLLRQIQLDESSSTLGTTSDKALLDVLLLEGRKLMQDLPTS